jgi:tetratricopeptide (TPR) repeat protein
MAGDDQRPEEIETAAGADATAPTLAEAANASSDGATLPVVSPEAYRVQGEVGRGGMGRVVSATDRRLGRPVAIKELHRDVAGGATRFVREALVTARLQHPSIVPVYEAGRWPDGVPFYAMKMVSGQSLSLLIRARHTLSARLALLPHVIAVAEAIAYAHSQRIIHRDLKPANVLVGPFGETVVVDWGLAKDLSRPSDEPATPASKDPPAVAGASADSTVVGTVLGTPHFMPPEQARGEAVDERADVYALGAILYYLLRGEPPHSGKTANEALAAVVSGAPEPIETYVPDAPQELCAIVRKAMSQVREERYPTAAELAADLRRFETGQLVTVHAYSTRELLARWVRRNRTAVIVAAALGLGLATSLVVGVAGVRREARLAEAERDKARLETQKAEAINAFVQDMLGSADPLEGSKDVTVAEVLDRAGRRAALELQKQPEIQAAVQLTIAHSEIGLGRLDKAEALAREALATRRRVLGPRTRDVAKALVEVGGALDQKGEFKQAGTSFQEALGILEELGLGATLDAANVRNDLASTYQYLGRNADAERLDREVLAQKRTLLESDDPALAESLNNLGVVVGQRGEWAEAEKLHREALAIMRKAHGPEHVEVAAAMRTLAAVLEAEKKFSEAEPLYKESLAQCTKLLGPTHPDTAWTLYNYAFMLRLEGKPEEAAARARQVLALRGKTLPDTHPMVAASQQVLGLSLIDMGRPEAAEPLLRESLALRRAALPGGHWLRAVSESVLGGCLTRLGRYADAEPLLISGYESLRSNPAVEREKVNEARARLAALYAAWHKPAKARLLQGAEGAGPVGR